MAISNRVRINDANAHRGERAGRCLRAPDEARGGGEALASGSDAALAYAGVAGRHPCGSSVAGADPRRGGVGPLRPTPVQPTRDDDALFWPTALAGPWHG